jgi:adenylate kinase family enzyme
MIIHISGPSGSGKTFLGNKLKENFGSKIVVKDLDDLRYEFVKNKYGSYKNIWKKKDFVWDKDAYQNWIYEYIKKQKKPIIFVGLNHMPWWNKDLYYDLQSNINFYIKLTTEKIFEQRCKRFLSDVFEDNLKKTVKEIIKNETKTIENLQEALKHECSYKEIKDLTDKWNKDYKKQNYKFLSSDKIFNEISKILS